MSRVNGFTRQEILTALKLGGAKTAEEVGEDINISPVAARQHLTAMESEGLITTLVERKGLGRPVHRYTITPVGDESFPRSYDVLATGILDEIQNSNGDEAVEKVLTNLRESTRSMYSYRLNRRAMPAKVHELVKIQSERGYMASSEQEGNGYLFTQFNCAVCKAAFKHPNICSQEVVIFQELLGDGTKVELDNHILKGDPFCSFKITPVSGP